MNFDGIWTPLVTPFDAEGRIDAAALQPLIDTLINQKVKIGRAHV